MTAQSSTANPRNATFGSRNETVSCAAVVKSDPVRRVRALSLIFATTVAMTGCMHPLHSRFPVMQPGHPLSERQAYQDQDPFPDPDIGPETSARPREFSRPRTESRRAAEQRIFHGLQSGPENVPPGYPRGGLRRPDAAY